MPSYTLPPGVRVIATRAPAQSGEGRGDRTHA
jgi:hypothetical protein